MQFWESLKLLKHRNYPLQLKLLSSLLHQPVDLKYDTYKMCFQSFHKPRLKPIIMITSAC